MATKTHSTWSWLSISMIVIIIDQLTKYYFAFSSAALSFGERRPVLPFLDWTLLYNKGAAFSFLANQPGWQRWFFTGLAIIVSIIIILTLRRLRQQPLLMLALALILGGAIGNVIDRVLHGHVIDFILVHYREDWFYPAFNVADMAITGGAILLIIDEIRRTLRHKNEAK